ncbi:putative allantoate permease protein [Ilyonectria robusta]
MNVPTGGLSAFAAQIISGIGNSKLETMLLTMPASPFQTLASLTVAIPQRWLKNKRCLSSAICCLIPLTCSILIKGGLVKEELCICLILIFTYTELPAENKTGRLLCYYFFYFFWGPYATGKYLESSLEGIQLTSGAVLSLPMANVSGHTKKLTVTASIFIAYCCAMIIGPQVFLTKEAPNYPTGYKCLMGFEIAAICLLGMYAVGCKIENKRRDKREGEYVELSLDAGNVLSAELLTGVRSADLNDAVDVRDPP